MISKLWIALVLLMVVAAARGQTSVSEVLTAADPNLTATQNVKPPASAPTPAAAPAPVSPPPAAPVTAPLAGPAVSAAPVGPSDSVFLLSIVKPLLFLIVVGLWAAIISRFDKDLHHNFLPREMWNGIQLAAGSLSFLIWLILPYFALGMFLALLISGSAITGYVFYRNQQVPPTKRWRISIETFNALFRPDSQAALVKHATIKLLSPTGAVLPLPASDEPMGPAHDALETLLVFMLPRRGDQFELIADAQQTTLSVQIDGVKYPQPSLDAKLGVSLIDYLKQSAALEVTDRRRKQSGKITFQDEENIRHTFEISTQGSTRGLILVARSDSGGQPRPLAKLGLLESQQKLLLAALEQPGRVVIVTSPPHKGQATTLYTLTSRHDPYTQSVLALEEDFKYDLEGVTHEKLEAGMDAAAVNQKLKAAMLREANVVLMSKLADEQTAAIIAQYAPTARFYVGMRYEDTFHALKAWVKLLGDTKAAGRSLSAIVSQRLLRRLCKTCRVPYKPDADVLRKLNLPAEKVNQFYKHSGQVMVKDEAQPCPDCLGLGFRGQFGVFEVMVLDDEARALLTLGQVEPLRAYLRKQKMLWLQEAALMKVIEGETSINEITRALANAKEPAAAKGA